MTELSYHVLQIAKQASRGRGVAWIGLIYNAQKLLLQVGRACGIILRDFSLTISL